MPVVLIACQYQQSTKKQGVNVEISFMTDDCCWSNLSKDSFRSFI